MDIPEITDKLYAQIDEIFKPPPIDDFDTAIRVAVTYKLTSGYRWGYKKIWPKELFYNSVDAVLEMTKEYAHTIYILHHAAHNLEHFVRMGLDEPIYESYWENDPEKDKEVLKYHWVVNGLLIVTVFDPPLNYQQPISVVLKRVNEKGYRDRIYKEVMEDLKTTVQYTEMIWDYLEHKVPEQEPS